MQFLTRFSVFLATLVLLSHPNIAKGENPYTGTTSVFVPFINASVNPDLKDSPTINVGFDGSGHYVSFTMDTGSVGIVASADIFTPARGAKYLGPGQQIYSSSGIIEVGNWWTAVQEIYDTDGNLVATAEVPVLQVLSIQCTPDARSCTPTTSPHTISIMGVGFAREGPEQPRGTPDYNAFLNLKTILQNGELVPLPDNWCNGYVVSPAGVSLGLTLANTADAGFVKLLPWTIHSTPQLSEWMPAPLTLVVNGTSGDGNTLLDTGVDAAFLTPPLNATLGPLVLCPDVSRIECLPNNDMIDVYLPDSTNPVAFYTFIVGQSGNPMEPDAVHVVPGSSVFFNTSRHVLGGFNFLYDNTNGYVGYIWNGQSPSSVGFVHPAAVSSVTTLASSNNPAWPTSTITFTATVAGISSPQIPTGGITFMIGKTQEFVPLNNQGVATFSTSLSRGSYPILAQYSGDATYIRSTSPVLIEYVGRN